MLDPDIWWGHLPVVSRPYSKLGDYWEWHRRQLVEAIDITSRKWREALEVIPKSGFYVMAYMSVWKYKVGDDDVGMGVSIWEDTEGVFHPKTLTEMMVASSGKIHLPLSILGSSDNLFISTFATIATSLEARWRDYLIWRRRQPRKPVPEWLVSLRAEEKRSKAAERRSANKAS